MINIQLTRLPGYDINGNPRYVCHYLNLLTEKEKHTAYEWDGNGRRISPTRYEIAINRSHKIGGRKYHTKAYGGGLVFADYENVIKAHIKRIVAEATEAENKS